MVRVGVVKVRGGESDVSESDKSGCGQSYRFGHRSFWVK